MTEPASLTRSEAEARAALISVRPLRHRRRHDRAPRGRRRSSRLDHHLHRATTPAPSTFVDCVAEVRHATLNGRALDLGTVDRWPAPAARPGRRQRARGRVGPGRHRHRRRASCAPSTRPTSSSTSGRRSSPTTARRVWACFDQPDLKAPHAFTVTAPESWTVTSNCAPDSIEAAGGRRRAGSGRSPTRRRSRRTSWSSTPVRSTRCAAAAAATTSASTARQSLAPVPRARRRGALRR